VREVARVGSATLAVVMVAVTLTAASVSASARDGSCADVLLVGARGSGEQGLGPTVGALAREFERGLRGRAELRIEPLEYPAHALWPPTRWGDLYGSVDQGAAATVTIVEAEARVCPRQSLLLVGYSLGALAIADAVDRLSPAALARVVGVALLADPRFNPSSAAARGQRIAGTRGVLGARPEFDRLLAVTRSWCRVGDPICSGWALLASISEHLAYPEPGGEAERAGHLLASAYWRIRHPARQNRQP
jgi:hypothetical protein